MARSYPAGIRRPRAGEECPPVRDPPHTQRPESPTRSSKVHMGQVPGVSVQGRSFMFTSDGSAPQCMGAALAVPVPQTAVCGITDHQAEVPHRYPTMTMEDPGSRVDRDLESHCTKTGTLRCERASNLHVIALVDSPASWQLSGRHRIGHVFPGPPADAPLLQLQRHCPGRPCTASAGRTGGRGRPDGGHRCRCGARRRPHHNGSRHPDCRAGPVGVRDGRWAGAGMKSMARGPVGLGWMKPSAGAPRPLPGPQPTSTRLQQCRPLAAR